MTEFNPHSQGPPEIAPRSPEYSQAEIMERLNQLDLPVQAKVDLGLVYLKEKPATEWSHNAVSRQPGWPDKNHGRERFDEVVAWAATTGLDVEVVERTVNPQAEQFRGVEGQWLRENLAAKGTLEDADQLALNPAFSADRLTLFIAQDAVKLEKMMAASRDWDPQAYGEAVGFPPSAVTVYVEHTGVSPLSSDADITLEEVAFGMYMISPDHPHDDLATARRWAKAVHEANPDLYEQMLAAASLRKGKS